MENQVPEQIKTVRSNELLVLDEAKRALYEKAFIGTTLEVLVEEKIQYQGREIQVGHTKEYLKILVDSEEDLQNKIINVEIRDCSQIIH